MRYHEIIEKLDAETFLDNEADELTEAFDQPYSIKWEEGEDSEAVDALATLGDGTYLNIMFSKEFGDYGDDLGDWAIGFHRNNSQEVSGEGDAQKVFATVLEAIRQFTKKYKPNTVTFSASKEPKPKMVKPGANANPESRAKLYNRLVQRYAGAMGYTAQQQEGNGKVTYVLKRASKGVAEEGYGTHPSQRVDPRTGKKYVPPKSPLGKGVAEGPEQEGLVSQFLKSITPKELRYYSIRDNCGPAALHMMDWAKEKGIELNRVHGYFVADNVVYDKADFTKEMKHEFLQQGLDFNDPKSRQEFIASNPKYSKEWKKVPHYWLQDDQGTVYDPTGYTQFIKTGVAKDLDKSRYETVQGVAENMDHSQDGRAVEELKAALLAKRDQLQSATDDQVYDIIDKMMTRIARSHSISGQKLHDMWVDKYQQIPDTWVMNENFINFMNKSLGTKVDKPQVDPLAHAPDFYKNAPVANARIRPAFLKALEFGLSVLAKLDAETKQELLAGGEQAICAYIDTVAKRTGATGFREEDVYECQDDLANIFHDPTMHSWVDVLQQDINENFADGKNPKDKGDSKRHGIPKHASLSQLDKIGHGSGRKAQLARWQANMRRGRVK